MTNLRIYNAMCHKSRKKSKGRKKKNRRLWRADYCDGWERKRSGGLAPSTFFERKLGEPNINDCL